MNTETLKKLLERELESELDFVSFVEGVSSDEVAERERQLFAFSRRLSGLKNLAKLTPSQDLLLPKIEAFVNRLESLDNSDVLYFWKAKSGNRLWGGWSTDNEILYSLESST